MRRRRLSALVVVLALLMLAPWPAVAQITVGAVTTSDQSGTLAASHTFSHTSDSGSDRVLLVGACRYFGSTVSITGITYNGVALTEIGQGPSQSDYRMSWWRLVAPATGANNVIVSYDGDNVAMFTAITLLDVDQTTPVENFASAGSNATSAPTVNVTSSTGSLVVDGLCIDGTTGLTATAGASQTERSEVNNATNAMAIATSTEAGATTTTMSWTLNSTRIESQGAFSVREATGGGPPPGQPRLLLLGVGDDGDVE